MRQSVSQSYDRLDWIDFLLIVDWPYLRRVVAFLAAGAHVLSGAQEIVDLIVGAQEGGVEVVVEDSVRWVVGDRAASIDETLDGGGHVLGAGHHLDPSHPVVGRRRHSLGCAKDLARGARGCLPMNNQTDPISDSGLAGEATLAGGPMA